MKLDFLKIATRKVAEMEKINANEYFLCIGRYDLFWLHHTLVFVHPNNSLILFAILIAFAAPKSVIAIWIVWPHKK